MVDIDKMEGRELDAFIAERLGFEWWSSYVRNYLMLPRHAANSDLKLRPSILPVTVTEDENYVYVPHYSTDHAAAYELGEEMAKRGLTTEYTEQLCDEYRIDHGDFYGVWMLIQASPLVRARAAAKVLQEAEGKR